MYFYQAYGLGIQSALPLPELLAREAGLDITIQFGKVIEPPPKGKAMGYYYWKQAGDTYLFWQELGTFRIREGREITINPAPQIEEARLRPPILGACMAVLLHQRGCLVLHSSAVTLPTGAVAFLGDKGWGKSTMMATLYERGHSFLTDDVLALDLVNPNCALALPAFPQMKLWPSALEAIGQDPETLPRLVPQLKKRQRLLSQGISQTSVPLKAIYLLGKGPDISITPLSTQDIISALLRHSYSGRFGKALLQHGEKAHFLQCMDLAKKVLVYHLQRPSDLSLLPEIAHFIEEHERCSAAS